MFKYKDLSLLDFTKVVLQLYNSNLPFPDPEKLIIIPEDPTRVHYLPVGNLSKEFIGTLVPYEDTKPNKEQLN